MLIADLANLLAYVGYRNHCLGTHFFSIFLQPNYPLPMAISKVEVQRLLERMIFDDTDPQDWVQDVWSLSPLLGDSAAKLLDAFYGLVECCPEESMDNLVKGIYREHLEF